MYNYSTAYGSESFQVTRIYNLIRAVYWCGNETLKAAIFVIYICGRGRLSGGMQSFKQNAHLEPYPASYLSKFQFGSHLIDYTKWFDSIYENNNLQIEPVFVQEIQVDSVH